MKQEKPAIIAKYGPVYIGCPWCRQHKGLRINAAGPWTRRTSIG